MGESDMEVRSKIFVSGFGVSASDISTKLGLTATNTSEDSPLSQKHKKSGYVSWTLWPEHCPAFSDDSPDESLQRALTLVKGKSGPLSSLKPLVRAELVMGIHLGDDQVSQIDISDSTIAQISELGLGLVFSIVSYPRDEE